MFQGTFRVRLPEKRIIDGYPIRPMVRFTDSLPQVFMIISESRAKSRIPNDHSSKLRSIRKKLLNNLQIIRKENFPITEIIT